MVEVGLKRDSEKGEVLESLRDWFKKEKWVRITTSGNIAGPCGTSKNKKNPDRCLPKAKAQSLSKGERAATARKKKKAGKKGKTVVANTKKAKVTREDLQNLIVGILYEKQGKNTILEKDDRCTRIAKRKYDTWPSAYASGAVVRCRRGEIWKNENIGVTEGSKEDEIKIHTYQTKHFHMCPMAKTLYKDIETKVEDVDLAVRTAKLQDALFALEMTALEDGATQAHLEAAELIADQIMVMAEMLGLKKEHSYIKRHVKEIEKAVE